MEKTICELFAGVGGFRLGFERANAVINKNIYNTVWFNQWEPKTKIQDAYECYISHFGKPDTLHEYTNSDISTVDKGMIPNFNILVGGFPCQDYSVAHSLSAEAGIQGKKGILWWDIYETIKAKSPAFCLFENVDRLLKSPSKQRGRDFGIMLSCLNMLGYSVEWRVVNAASYGAVQRRKRTFIFAYRNDTRYACNQVSDKDALFQKGFFSKCFPVCMDNLEISYSSLPNTVQETSNSFSFNFGTAGRMTENHICTANPKELIETPEKMLCSIIEDNVDNRYYLTDEKYDKLKYLKGSKKFNRTSKNGFTYTYSEGACAFPDPLDRHGRTMLTSEGTINRCSHVIQDSKGFRMMTPLEAERMQGFDDNWTDTGMSERMRYFCMGNALVVPMVEKMAYELSGIIDNEE